MYLLQLSQPAVYVRCSDLRMCTSCGVLPFLRCIVVTCLTITFQQRGSRLPGKRMNEFFGHLQMVCKQYLSTLAYSDKWKRYPLSIWPNEFPCFVHYVITLQCFLFCADLMLSHFPFKLNFFFKLLCVFFSSFFLSWTFHFFDLTESFPIHSCLKNYYIFYEGLSFGVHRDCFLHECDTDLVSEEMFLQIMQLRVG